VTDLLTAALERARARDLGAIELIATADRLGAAGESRLAALLYRGWLDHAPDDLFAYAINFNLGSLLSSLGDLPAAAAALAEAIRLNPDFIPPYINLGMVLERAGHTTEALGQWYAVVNRLAAVNSEAIAHKTAALKQLGRVLGASHLDSAAEDALRLGLDVAPGQRDILQHWLSLRQRQCLWPVMQPTAGFIRSELVAGMSPLSLAAYTDDPLLQLATAAAYARRDVGRPARNFAETHERLLQRGQPARLRIGYLSSDLREHAIGHLMAELFELHDPANVEIFAYYCGHQVDDAMHQRFKATAHAWVDIAGMTDEQAAERIVADEINILVDVNGYTHSARTRVLAMRPAPVIVNWLGFPNTAGSAFHNYIIADDVIIPPGSEIFYSEAVKRLPCYQPNNRRRVIADAGGTRQAAGLPEHGTVFCCFNAAHKFSRFTWQRWMRILHGVPGSVLWLLDGVPSTNDRLREHAAAQGVAPERIVFAPKLANPFHLARYVLADLFLDSSPYGAHTTGSDALWMGVPVLTVPGRCFASRVCASLVTAAGLPEMVCTSSDEYVARGIALGNDRPRLADLGVRLRAGRDGCTLFNTPLLVSCLESVYREMWAEALDGRTPRPDLSNLEIYGEIGAELDQDDVEMAEADDYTGLYLAKLAERDTFGMIPPDRRLWRGA
jgi:predicted O-linked N-acetylglucosamine transferase (SPINDLY family)